MLIGWIAAVVSTFALIKLTAGSIPDDLSIDIYRPGEGLTTCIALARRYSTEATLNGRIAWITGAAAALFGVVGGILGPETPTEHDGKLTRYIKHSQGVIWLPLSGLLVLYMNYRLDRAKMSAELAADAIGVVARQPGNASGHSRADGGSKDRESYEACMVSRATWEEKRTAASQGLRRHFNDNAYDPTSPRPVAAPQKTAIVTEAQSESLQRLYTTIEESIDASRKELDSTLLELSSARNNTKRARPAARQVSVEAQRLKHETKALRQTARAALDDVQNSIAKSEDTVPAAELDALKEKLKSAEQKLASGEKKEDELQLKIKDVEKSADSLIKRPRPNPEPLVENVKQAKNTSDEVARDYEDAMESVQEVSKELSKELQTPSEPSTAQSEDPEARAAPAH